MRHEDLLPDVQGRQRGLMPNLTLAANWDREA